MEGLTGAAVIAAYGPNNPSSAQRAQMAALVGQLISMKYGRADASESDRLGMRFLSDAGYDPRADRCDEDPRAGGRWWPTRVF